MGQENKEDVAEIRRDASEIKDCTTIEEMKAEIERQSLHNNIVYGAKMMACFLQSKLWDDKMLIMLSYHLLKQNEHLKKQLEEKFLKEPIRITGFGMAGAGSGMMIIDDPMRPE